MADPSPAPADSITPAPTVGENGTATADDMESRERSLSPSSPPTRSPNGSQSSSSSSAAGASHPRKGKRDMHIQIVDSAVVKAATAEESAPVVPTVSSGAPVGLSVQVHPTALLHSSSLQNLSSHATSSTASSHADSNPTAAAPATLGFHPTNPSSTTHNTGSMRDLLLRRHSLPHNDPAAVLANAESKAAPQSDGQPRTPQTPQPSKYQQEMEREREQQWKPTPPKLVIPDSPQTPHTPTDPSTLLPNPSHHSSHRIVIHAGDSTPTPAEADQQQQPGSARLPFQSPLPVHAGAAVPETPLVHRTPFQSPLPVQSRMPFSHHNNVSGTAAPGHEGQLPLTYSVQKVTLDPFNRTPFQSPLPVHQTIADPITERTVLQSPLPVHGAALTSAYVAAAQYRERQAAAGGAVGEGGAGGDDGGLADALGSPNRAPFQSPAPARASVFNYDAALADAKRSSTGTILEGDEAHINIGQPSPVVDQRTGRSPVQSPLNKDVAGVCGGVGGVVALDSVDVVVDLTADLNAAATAPHAYGSH